MQAGLVVSCHDVSEGGLAVALAEMCIAGRLGARIHTLTHDDPATALFAESMGRLVVEVEQASVPAFLRVMHNQVHLIGEVAETDTLELSGIGSIAVSELADAFNSAAVIADIDGMR